MTIVTAKEREKLAEICLLLAYQAPPRAVRIHDTLVSIRGTFLEVSDEIKSQAAEIERMRGATLSLCESASTVMNLLDEHGARFVDHLLDTDDNPGQRLRDDISRARATLSESEP